MSALRGFDPRRNRPAEPSTPPKAPNPPKGAAAAQPSLGALAALGEPTDSHERDPAVADIIRRAGNAFSPDVMADEAELCIRGELA
jgi:hypothetical protein